MSIVRCSAPSGSTRRRTWRCSRARSVRQRSTAPPVDFTAGGKYADVFSNFKTFATLSATFEDLGVAAYKGQAGNLIGTPVLTTALQIHSVEARHASAVRPLIGKAGYDGAFDKPKTRAQVLAAAKPFLA